MTDITIPVKGLRRVVQRAKDLHEHNVTIKIHKGAIYFSIGDTPGHVVVLGMDAKEKRNG